MAPRRPREDELPSDSKGKGAIESRYYRLASLRQQYLDRARDCAKLTIPSLIPPFGVVGNYRFPTPYQSVGARAVNHLASKLAVALFPNTPFFRHIIDDYQVEAEIAALPDEGRGTIEQALGKYDRAIMSYFERSALRVPCHLSLKLLIVGGNALLYIDPKTGKGRTYGLPNYVVRRDPTGAVLEIILKEDVDEDLLPKEAKEELEESEQSEEAQATQQTVRPSGPENVAYLFTYIKRSEDGKWWEVSQEVNGSPVKEANGRFALDKCPWIPLRMVVVDGEDYGRSLVEEYFGDLNSLEKLQKAIVQFAGAAAKIVFLVKPNATTKSKKLATAQSGDFVVGNKDDISVLQIEKYADFKVVKETADAIESRLAYAFLMNSAVQRNAERVTAEEIRLMAQELDAGFGGIFANLSLEMQMPIVAVCVANLKRTKRLPNLPPGVTRPTIVTGIDALGRGNDMANLNAAMSGIAVLGPQGLAAIKPQEYVRRIFAANNVDPTGLVKTAGELQQEATQAALANTAQEVAPAAATALIKHAGTAAANQVAAPPAPPQQQAQ